MAQAAHAVDQLRFKAAVIIGLSPRFTKGSSARSVLAGSDYFELTGRAHRCGCYETRVRTPARDDSGGN